MSEESKQQIRAVLSTLTETEREVLSRVLMLEGENLYLKAPRVKEDIIKIIREVVK